MSINDTFLKKTGKAMRSVSVHPAFGSHMVVEVESTGESGQVIRHIEMWGGHESPFYPKSKHE